MNIYHKIILDNGHGSNTAGKRSPDGTFLEYEFNRAIVQRILALAQQNLIGDKFINLVPENWDVPLGNFRSKYDCRIKRVNDILAQDPESSHLLISVHANAAGNGSQWHNARGFGVFYDTKRGEGVKKVARIFADNIAKGTMDEAIDEYAMPVLGYNGLIETSARYSIIYFPNCDALLLELGFMDNKEEVEYLKSESGRDEIALSVYKACTDVLVDNFL